MQNVIEQEDLKFRQNCANGERFLKNMDEVTSLRLQSKAVFRSLDSLGEQMTNYDLTG